MKADFDGSVTYWGHMIEKQWGSTIGSDGGYRVQGCMTPLPEKGKTILLADGFVWLFTEVKPDGNPADGFTGYIVPFRGVSRGSEFAIEKIVPTRFEALYPQSARMLSSLYRSGGRLSLHA